jgi:hypothetical protein
LVSLVPVHLHFPYVTHNFIYKIEGEMFDLERLAKECATAQRWSFFFTSAPLNIPGGVASPPNAIAIL